MAEEQQSVREIRKPQALESKEGLIDVKSGLYTAVMGALGAILTLFAIPVAPNIHINLYVFSGVMVGGTSGAILGALAGFIGSLYTPVLWGWLGAIPYNMILGASAGFFSTRFGLRPTLGALLGHVISLPYQYAANVLYLGLPLEIFWVGMGTTVIQLIVAGVIAESLMSIPALKKRLPKAQFRAADWVARNRLLRHPWVENPATN
ncbi:MAG: hypothetical protein GX579_21080 [Chloroflexi bacterium]|nr:hypothetical protein [Chloroflexota bacterium]